MRSCWNNFSVRNASSTYVYIQMILVNFTSYNNKDQISYEKCLSYQLQCTILKEMTLKTKLLIENV